MRWQPARYTCSSKVDLYTMTTSPSHTERFRILRVESGTHGRTANAVWPAVERIRPLGFTLPHAKRLCTVYGDDDCCRCLASRDSVGSFSTAYVLSGVLGSFVVCCCRHDHHRPPSSIPAAGSHLAWPDLWRCVVLCDEHVRPLHPGCVLLATGSILLLGVLLLDELLLDRDTR